MQINGTGTKPELLPVPGLTHWIPTESLSSGRSFFKKKKHGSEWRERNIFLILFG